MKSEDYLLSYPQASRFLFFAVCDESPQTFTAGDINRTLLSADQAMKQASKGSDPEDYMGEWRNEQAAKSSEPQLFCFKTYHAASRACSRLRGQGHAGVRLVVIWGEGMGVYDIEALSVREKYKNAQFFMGKFLIEPTQLDDPERSVVEFDWMDEVLHVSGQTGYVQVPKHVLDHRVADGDSDRWGKLQRGLVEEIYLTKGKMDFIKAGALLDGMTMTYDTSSEIDC